MWNSFFPAIWTLCIKLLNLNSFCCTDTSCALDRLQSFCIQRGTEQTPDYAVHGSGVLTHGSRSADTRSDIGLGWLRWDISQTMYLMFVFPATLSHVPVHRVTQLKVERPACVTWYTPGLQARVTFSVAVCLFLCPYICLFTSNSEDKWLSVHRILCSVMLSYCQTMLVLVLITVS